MTQARHVPNRILVPVDYDACGSAALKTAIELATAIGAPVDVLYVWAAPYASSAVSSADERSEPHTLFDRARERSADAMREFIRPHQDSAPGVELEWFVESGLARDKILEHARTRNCELIIMGTHRRASPQRWWLGSVAEYVVRHAPCPVMVVPHQAASTGESASSSA